MLPRLPPAALAQPPPLTVVVSQGNQALTDVIAANSATNQPGRGRAIAATIACLAESTGGHTRERPAAQTLSVGGWVLVLIAGGLHGGHRRGTAHSNET